MSSTPRFSQLQLRSVLSRWPVDSLLGLGSPGERHGCLRFTPIESGFSGALVFRVAAGDSALPGTCYALKASVESAINDRCIGIAKLVAAAAENCDLLVPPLLSLDGSSRFVHSLGYRWELARWIPGETLHSDAPAEAIMRGGEAIGMVHRALSQSARERRIANKSPGADPPRCITDRMERLRHLTPVIDELARRSLSVEQLADQMLSQLSSEQGGDTMSNLRCQELAQSLIAARDLLSQRWQRIVPRLLRELTALGSDQRRWAATWVLRDVHRDHVLFSQTGRREVCGILDYDAVDWDSPAADLARWSGDFWREPTLCSGEEPLGWHPALEAAVAGYQRVCPFSEYQIELARTLIEVNAMGALANWLAWLIVENRRFRGQASAIRSRIIHLIASVCRIC